MMATLNEGDEVIIPAPYWVSYPDIVLLAGGNPIIIKCSENENFKITPEKLKNHINILSKILLMLIFFILFISLSFASDIFSFFISIL